MKLKVNLNLQKVCFHVLQFQNEKLSCACKNINV